MLVLSTGARETQDAKKCNLKVPSATSTRTNAGRFAI